MEVGLEVNAQKN